MPEEEEEEGQMPSIDSLGAMALARKNIKRLNLQNLHVIPLPYDIETPTLSWPSRRSRPRGLK